MSLRALPFLLLVALLAACATGCRDNGGTPVPRPRAYPRIDVPDSAFTTLSADGVAMAVNTSASVRRGQNNGLDIAYPRLNSTLYISINRYRDNQELARAIANRNQRMALNTGSERVRTDEFTNDAGFFCRMISAGGASAIPVQFTAAGPGRTLVSGAAVFSVPVASADSVAPASRALQRDILHLLLSIAPAQ